MSMQEDSNALHQSVVAISENEGPAAEPCQKKERKYRRLRSLTTNKILHQKKDESAVKKTFDPTAWYVYGVKRNKEIVSRDFFTSTGNKFKSKADDTEYAVEAYAAVQLKKVRIGKKSGKAVSTKKSVEKVVIHGKIFIRVDKTYRVDVMRQCSFLTHCVTDPSLSRTEYDSSDFARVPDDQIQILQSVLNIADGEVEFSEDILPQINETVSLNDGFLSESEELKGLKGTVEMVNGKKTATIILDKIGCFKFTLPLEDLKRSR